MTTRVYYNTKMMRVHVLENVLQLYRLFIDVNSGIWCEANDEHLQLIEKHRDIITWKLVDEIQLEEDIDKQKYITKNYYDNMRVSGESKHTAFVRIGDCDISLPEWETYYICPISPSSKTDHYLVHQRVISNGLFPGTVSGVYDVSTNSGIALTTKWGLKKANAQELAQWLEDNYPNLDNEYQDWDEETKSNIYIEVLNHISKIVTN